MDNTYSQTYPYEKRYKYPHMAREDVLIWERFIEQFPEAYDTVQYDVPVGSDPEFIDALDQKIGGEEWRLYQKKIDVVGYKGENITIIELKPRASASVVGQIKMYKTLFTRDYNPPVKPKLVVITNEASLDFREFARDEGVTVIVV